MQKNREIGKIQKDVPILIGRAVNHFIRDFTQRCAEITQKRGKTNSCMNFKLTKEHVKEAIESTPKFTFLRKIVEDIKLTEPSNETVYILQKTTTQTFKKQDEISFQKKPLKRLREETESNEDCDDEYEYNGGLSYVQELTKKQKKA
jgi:hypothetical protein